MKPEALAKWEETRAKGKAHYILLRGVLGFGLPMFIAMTLLVDREDLSARFIVLSAAAWLIGGAAFGAITWIVSERQYCKATQSNGA